MTLWTPGGEHPVDRGSSAGAGPPPPSGPGATGREATAEPTDDPLAGLSPEERARAEAMVGEMADARRQLAEAPAAVVVANHAMGLYELAAIHLSQQPPKLGEAKVAIDGFGALVTTLEGRLGEDEPTLQEALNQVRLAFVQLSREAAAGTGGAAPTDT